MCVGAFVSLALVAYFRKYKILLTGATGLKAGNVSPVIYCLLVLVMAFTRGGLSWHHLLTVQQMAV